MHEFSLGTARRATLDCARLAIARIRRPLFSPSCALHGIQRSGTNYLEACLGQLGIFPINCVIEVRRDHPRHKHFRWAPDKSTIPGFIAHQYGNTLTADSVTQLNKLAGYPRNCRHLVMQKPKLPWLASVCNWGLRGKWFASKQEALGNLDVLERDYDAYYGFWWSLGTNAPDQVLVLDHAEQLADVGVLLDGLGGLGIRHRRSPGFNGSIGEVRMSPPDRRRDVSVKDVVARLATRDAT